MGRQILIVTFGVLVALSAAPANAVSLRSAFKSISTETTWPVDGTDAHDLESAFGPRIKESTDAYDWHPGIDIKAEEGVAVLAAVEGRLEKVMEFPNGGLSVILKHEFAQPVTFHGQVVDQYYTYYMHLSSVNENLLAASEAGERPVVARGEVIGEVGHSGTAIGDHLHLELRLGTMCSLAYQISHPESPCASLGFDPQVNPLFLFPTTTADANLFLLFAQAGQNQRLGYKSPNNQPLVNKVEWQVVKKSSGKVVESQVINYNLRRGVEAGESGTFDTQDKTQLFIASKSWNQSADWFRTVMVIPWSTLEPYHNNQYQLRFIVKDIWGRKVVKNWEVGE